jgi:hypothetical protein
MSSRLARFAVAGGMVLLAFPAVATAAPSPKLALTWLEAASAAAVPGRLESGAALNGFSLRAASLQGYAFPNEPKGTLPSGASTRLQPRRRKRRRRPNGWRRACDSVRAT